MAEPTDHLRERKRALALSLAASRERLREEGREFSRSMNPMHAASNYLHRHPLQIFGATTGAIALLTYLLRPRGERKPPKSFLRRLLGWVISFVKASIRSWFLNQAKGYLLPKEPETDSLLGP